MANVDEFVACEGSRLLVRDPEVRRKITEHGLIYEGYCPTCHTWLTMVQFTSEPRGKVFRLPRHRRQEPTR